jgi:hypothetical protein
MIWNSEVDVLMVRGSFSSPYTNISSLGSFLIISEKSFEETTKLPSSSPLTMMVFSILISRSEAANVNSFPFNVKRIPFRIGIVVLVVTALETVLMALTNVVWSQMNLIKIPPVAYINIFFCSSHSSRGCGNVYKPLNCDNTNDLKINNFVDNPGNRKV